jgi:hypothetical protein
MRWEDYWKHICKRPEGNYFSLETGSRTLIPEGISLVPHKIGLYGKTNLLVG